MLEKDCVEVPLGVHGKAVKHRTVRTKGLMEVIREIRFDQQDVIEEGTALVKVGYRLSPDGAVEPRGGVNVVQIMAHEALELAQPE